MTELERVIEEEVIELFETMMQRLENGETKIASVDLFYGDPIASSSDPEEPAIYPKIFRFEFNDVEKTETSCGTKSQKEVYDELYRSRFEHVLRMFEIGLKEEDVDKARRTASIYAVQNTVKEWRRQNGTVQ